jgi:hypothetical protein
VPTLSALTVLSTPQGTIIVICALELVLLVSLIYAYSSVHASPDLRNILKDVFLGWNTALALALNSGTKAIVTHPADSTIEAQSSSTPTPTDIPVIKV